ncbi:MAG TPA: DNA processing protein DprA, partial [Micromonosporaceae bacterium]|nr:DNA processing protein DprA [Micromonosporaceae bacterium]
RTEGIRLVTGWPHVLEEVGSIGDLAPVPRGPEDDRDHLDPTATQVLDAVPRRRPAGSEAIARTAGLPLRDVLASLSLLEAGGFVLSRGAGTYSLPPPPKPARPRDGQEAARPRDDEAGQARAGEAA